MIIFAFLAALVPLNVQTVSDAFGLNPEEGGSTQNLLLPMRVDLDCSDYGVREATERDLYIDGVSDPYGLDRDNDGNACETLPSGAWWLAVPTLLGFLVFGRIRDNKDFGGDVSLEASLKRLAIPGVITAVLSLWLMFALPNWLPRSTPPVAYALIGVGVAFATIHFKYRDI